MTPQLLTAPATPSASDRRKASTPPPASSAAVIGMRAANSCAIGLPVRSETPRSPVTALSSHRP